ncbi:MAG TPA: class I adenylate-forming enzyme family protein [Acidimicrobiia bacterium]|nr:class I adenylate-forming enzyme family protein [Acidimicrobiia bacterium]
MTDGRTLRWHDDEQLTPAQRAALSGPGAPFERTVEDVLGAPVEVFVQRPRNLVQVLQDAVAQFGDRPYLLFPHETVTFSALPARTAAYAKVLADEYGVGKGDRVAFASANSLPYALAEWATVVLGGIIVGLNGWWTGPELAYGVQLTSPKVLFGDEARLDRLAEVGITDGDVPLIPFETLVEQVAARADTGVALPEVAIDEDDPFMILFTSGTTGRPKGATLTHRNLVHMGSAMAFGRAVSMLVNGIVPSPDAPPPASICATPFFHISGTAPLFMTGARFGSTLIFPPPGRWDPGTQLQLTAEHRVSAWSGVPTQFWRMLEHPDFDAFDLSSLTLVSSGGAPFPPELMRVLNEKIPTAQLSNGYGMSETMGAGTLLSGARYVTHRESVGAPYPTIEVQIRDDDRTVLPEGEVGEICLRGAVVFRGYWDDPDATAAVLDAERWYHSGDYGRIDDGVLWLESRMRDLILRGGENIYPMEIEHRLIEHPDIADAAVIGVEHRTLGQEVKAFVVLQEGASLEPAAVQEWAGQSLAPFKVPAYVEFRDSLPYTQTGKVMKHELEREQSSS